jgi:hypothetical protein
MSRIPQKFILTADENWQYRRAQSLPEAFARAVRRVCEANEAIRACYVLDARRQAGADVKLVIALSLDDEAKHMDSVVIALQEMLRDFPETAKNTAIMSAKPFESVYAGADFYRRQWNWATLSSTSPHCWYSDDKPMIKTTILGCLLLLSLRLTGQDFDALAKATPRKNAALIRLLGQTNEFSARAQVDSFTSKGDVQTSLPMTITISNRKMREDIYMSEMPQIPSEAKAILKLNRIDTVSVLTRFDDAKVILLFPGVEAYAEFSIPQDVQDYVASALRSAALKRTDIGRESFNGISCAKVKATLSDGRAVSEEAILWCAPDETAFPVRIDFTTPHDPAKYLFKDVRHDRPSSATFIVPTNYVRYANSREIMKYAIEKNKQQSGASTPPRPWTLQVEGWPKVWLLKSKVPDFEKGSYRKWDHR